jgi:delta 1-pyrroline-5-carboxylate dehydrogenase
MRTTRNLGHVRHNTLFLNMATETPSLFNGTSALTFDTFHNVIDGELSDTEVTRYTDNPSTLEANPEVPVSTQKDVDRAVAAAEKAAEAWAEVPWAERRQAIEAYADALEAHATEYGHLLVKEMGLPVRFIPAFIYNIQEKCLIELTCFVL